jgi:hypothetical protein
MMNWNWQDEWAVIKSSIPEWESFIFSKEIFWPLLFGKDSIYRGDIKPRLSAGRLLIALNLLDYFQKSNYEIENTVHKDFQVIKDLKSQWKSNWTKKVLAEIPFRSRQWEDIIQQIRKSSMHNTEFQNQVQIRLILDCLINESPIDVPDQAKSKVILLDQQLKNYSQSASFVWNEEISSAFDRDNYWYLYCRIKS